MALTRRPPTLKTSAAAIGPNAAKSGATLTGVFLQSSVYATPIPIVYGSARVAPNLLHLTNLTQLKSSKKTSKVGVSADFSANVILGLCEGPIAGFGVVWKDRNEPVLFSAFEPGFWTPFLGTSAQSPWSHLPAAEQVPYQFTAYLAGLGITLPGGNPSTYSVLVQGFLPFGGAFRSSDAGHCVGSAGSLTALNTTLTEADDYFDSGTIIFTSGANVNLAYPVARSLHASGQVQTLVPMANAPVNGDQFLILPSGDASPADIFQDLLTNTQYGVGIPAAYIASLAPFAAYCAAAGVFVSPVYDTQQAAAQTIDELLQIANSALVWSDGTMKIIPYGDTTITGNGVTFTPNTTPVYALTDDDFLPGSPGSDPIKVTRKRPADAYNRVTVTYEDNSAASGYAASVAQAEDLASIEAYGIRDMPPVDLRPIRSAIVAKQVAQLLLQRQVAIRNSYAFKLGWAKGSLLEPMDLVEITDIGLGFAALPVRIVSIAELEGEKGFELTCEDWPEGTATAVAFPTQGGQGYQPNAAVDPGNTASPVLFEGPRPLASSPLEIWIGASGGPNWGGCDVYFSTDNVTFQKVGSITQKASFGVLTANCIIGSPYPPADTANTLSVDLTASGGSLLTVSATDFAALRSLCYVAGANPAEFLGYETATLTSLEHYNLTTLARGLYGIGPFTHLTGDAFVFCDQSLLHFPFPQGTDGQTVYFKFPAFNAFGLAAQSLAAVSSVSHVIGQPPNIVEPIFAVEIAQLSASGSTATFTVTIHDPSGELTATEVNPSMQGLVALNNDTLGVPASTWVATIGVPYQFTATLQPPADGGGYVKFRAFHPSFADGWGLWYTSTAAQDAAPSTVIAIGNNQSSSVFTAKASATINAPSDTDHILWLASTSSQPSQAAVLAGGATVSGGGPFTIADLGVNLNLGDTVYLSVQPVDALGRFSNATFIVATKVRESINASKTATFSLSSFVRAQYPFPNPDIVTQAGGVDYVQAVGNVPGQLTPQQAYFTANFTLPDNCVITSISEDMFASLVGLGSHNTGAVFGAALGTDIYSGGAFVSVTAPNTAAWSTQAATCSQSTTGKRFLIAISLITNAAFGTDDVRFRAFSVTYTSANTQASL